MTTPSASPADATLTEDLTETDRPWSAIVWDDPVNLMSYVVYVFQVELKLDRARATDLMLQVHHEGKAMVATGDRSTIETTVAKLQVRGLWATMQQD